MPSDGFVPARRPIPAKIRLRRLAAVVGAATEVRTDSPRVVLTFDDGPDPQGTPAVLAALADADVRATFFVLLSRARLYPRLLDDVAAGGHDIALHGTDHRPLTTLPATEVRRRLADGKAELEGRIGRAVVWMRPPYGRHTASTFFAIRRAGLLPVLWNSTAADSRDVPHHKRIAGVRAGGAPGTVLLCHDGFADVRDGVDDGPPPVVDRGGLVRDIVQEYVALGLRPGSLSEALHDGTFVRQAMFRR